MSGIVEYIVAIRGQIDGAISKAFDQIGKSAAGMTGNVNKAEAALAGMQQKAMAAVKSYETAANAAMKNSNAIVSGVAREQTALMNARTAMTQYGLAGVEASQRVKSLSEAHRELIKLQKEAALTSKYAGGPVPPGGVAGGGSSAGMMDKMWTAFGAYYLAKTAGHAIGSMVAGPSEVYSIRKRMEMTLGGDDAAKSTVAEAYQKAYDLSGKYKNTRVAENLKIIDDLRANLPETMHHIISDATEPFVKMHSILKSLNADGKHKGSADKALGAVSTAIRSGELAQNLTGEQLAKHVQSIVAAQLTFGHKYDINKVFTAQKAAGVAYTASDDVFKYVYFPALEQVMGQRAGTGLQTLYNKLVGGIMVRQAMAERWRDLGLVDMDQVKLNKKGQIDQKSLVGNKWLKDSDVLGRNVVDWMMGTLMPALGRSGKVGGLDGEAFAKAWADKNTEKLVETFNKIDKADMQRVLAGLGYDRTAIQEMSEIIGRAAGMARDLKNMEVAVKGIENTNAQMKDLGTAMERVKAQADRMWQSVMGPAMPALTGAAEKLGDVMSGMADAHPVMMGKGRFGFPAAITGFGTPGQAFHYETGITAGSEMLAKLMPKISDELRLEQQKRMRPQDYYPMLATPPPTGWGDFRGDQIRMREALAAEGSFAGAKRAFPIEGEGALGVAGGLSRGPGAAVAAAAQRIQVESQVKVHTHFDPVTFSPVSVTVNVPNGGSQTATSTASGGHPRGEALATGSSSTAH